MKMFLNSVDDFLHQLDFFGQPVTLLFQKRETFSTRYGQISSLFLIFFTLHAFTSLSVDMFTQSYPNIVQQIQGDANPESYYFTPDNFQVLFDLEDQNRNPIDNQKNGKIYHLDIQFCHYSRSFENYTWKSTSQCVNIPYISCKEPEAAVELLEVANHQYKKMPEHLLYYGHCINKTHWLQVLNATYLHGQKSSTEFGVFKIDVTPCKNTTREKKCADSSLIKKTLSHGIYKMIYLEYSIDQSASSNPYQMNAKHLYHHYSESQTSSLDLKLRHSRFSSQTNYYYYFPTTEIYSQVVHVDTTESKTVRRDEIVQIEFTLDHKREFYFRYYSTFFDILGSLGGIYSFLLFFFGIMIRPLTKTSGTVGLLNSIYSFQSNQSQKDLEGLKNQANKNLKPNIKAKRVLQRDKGGLTLKNFEILVIGCCGRKKAIVEKGAQVIVKQLDIGNILNKLVELEKLKKLLLTDDQFHLFKYIPKPKLKDQYNSNERQIQPESEISIESEISDQEPALDQVIIAYLRMKRNEGLDSKLVNMLDLKTKDFLEYMAQDSSCELNPSSSKSQIKILLDQVRDSDKEQSFIV